MQLLSKGEFARHIGVSPGRVSQYLSAGIIGPDALSGKGHTAKVVVEKAVEQIKARRHVGQALGNGLLTRLDDPAPPAQPDLAASDPTKPAGLAEQIQAERLEQERRKNRREAIEEAQQLGRLIEGEELQRAVAKTAQDLINTFTGMAPDIANAIAAKFELPQRDVLHLVRQVMNEKRGAAAQAARQAAEALPETVDAEVEAA